MTASPATQCCVPFDPALWDDKETTWQDKLFVQDRVRSILHIPLNFRSVMMRNTAAMQAAGALPRPLIVLSDENSLWGADVYIEATAEVPGLKMARISGTFLSRVFEGPYRDMGKWVAQMKEFVAAHGRPIQKLYFYYTTCPKCAKEYGKNYVVLLAQV